MQIAMLENDLRAASAESGLRRRIRSLPSREGMG